MTDDESRPRLLPTGDELLRYLQEKSEDIERVLIPQSVGMLT